MQGNSSAPPNASSDDAGLQTVFVTKRELALIVERYLKDEKLDKTLQMFQQEQAKLLKNTRVVRHHADAVSLCSMQFKSHVTSFKLSLRAKIAQ
jgi:hypothetical protein